jgi:hypothetical protein
MNTGKSLPIQGGAQGQKIYRHKFHSSRNGSFKASLMATQAAFGNNAARRLGHMLLPMPLFIQNRNMSSRRLKIKFAPSMDANFIPRIFRQIGPWAIGDGYGSSMIRPLRFKDCILSWHQDAARNISNPAQDQEAKKAVHAGT